MKLMFVSGLSLAICCVTMDLSGAPKRSAAEIDLIGAVLDDTGIDKGISVILNAGNGDLALDLAGASELFVHVWEPDRERVEAVRRRVDEAALWGKRVIVERGEFSALPHAEHIVDLILAVHLSPQGLEALPLAEIMRALRPGGKAVIGSWPSADTPTAQFDASTLTTWLKQHPLGDAQPEVHSEVGAVWAVLTKPPLAGADDWSHWEHGPDNNPVSEDTVIKAPYMTQWLGQPYYIAMPAITTSAAGRIFLAMGHIAHHKREEPWLNTLIARNAYNGTHLWTRKLPDGYLVHRSAFIATKNVFHMIDTDGDGCLRLDAQTGEELGRIQIPRLRGQWKWMAIHEGILYALVGKKKDPPQTTVVRSKLTHWSWSELSKGYYDSRVPWGFGHTVVAYDLTAQKELWRHREAKPIDSRAMVIGGDKVFLYSPDTRMVAVDAQSGEKRWTNDDKELLALIEQPGRGLSSTPGFRTMTFCVYTPDALVFQAQTRMNVVSVSPHNGKQLWNRPKTTNNPNTIWVGDNLLVGIGDRGETLAVNSQTGETLATLNFAKRACTRLTATSDSLFCRGTPDGITRFDRYTREVQFNGAVRPSCNDGVIAANGLLYVGPWLCDCNLNLIGRVSFCSAGNFRFSHPVNEAERLQMFEGVTTRQLDTDTDLDWSAYRGDHRRGSNSPVDIAESVFQVWTQSPDEPFTPTAPTTSGDLFYVGGDDGKVRAYATGNGALIWSALTAGAIHQPPTIVDGRAYVGSGDGHVYAFDASNGRVVWRFRAAPVERRIPVYGSLASTWPVHGILVHEGTLYAAAGIIDYDGTYVYALDAKTGRLKWQNDTSGHLNPKLRKGASAQGYLSISEDRLWLASGNVASPAAYDLQTGEYRGPPVDDGSPRTNRGEEIGVFRGRHVLIGGRLRYSAAKRVVDPARFHAYTIKDDDIGESVSLLNSRVAPAWTKNYVVLVDEPGEGPGTAPIFYDANAFAVWLDNPSAERPAPRGTLDALAGTNIVAVAAAANLACIVSERSQRRSLHTEWRMFLVDPRDAMIIWEAKLEHPVRSSGIAIDRQGRIILLGDEGQVTVFGDANPAAGMLDEIIDLIGSGPHGKEQALVRLRTILRTATDDRILKWVLEQFDDLDVEFDAEGHANGALTVWRAIGPFPWDANNPSQAVFVGEPNVDPEGILRIRNRVCHWRPIVTDDLNGKFDLVRLFGSSADVSMYAYAQVELDKAQKLHLKLGSNDGFRCWFNKKLIGASDGGRSYRPDDSVFTVDGQAGTNEVLVKVLQMGNRWALGVRLTDPNGDPLKFKQVYR